PWAPSTRVVSTRVVSTCVVSCAPSAVTRSGTATSAVSRAWLERQIVVLLIQRLRKRLERFRLALGRHLGRRLHARRVRTLAAAALGCQHDQLAGDDLGDVPRLLVPVFPRSEEHTSELQSRFDLVC